MEIRRITDGDIPQIAPMVADFRVALRSYKGIASKPNIEVGAEELQEYLDAGFPCFAALDNGVYVGYLVCRIDEPCVWVESIYTAPAARRKGVAAALLRQAESIAQGYGEETVFHYVHPNNHGMIEFLRRHGYTVLNLIEIRKPFAGETPRTTIQVGEHRFDY